jgi:hypothetical protein
MSEARYTVFTSDNCFPEKNIQEEIQIGDSVQLSLFDFMDMNTVPVEKKAPSEESLKEIPQMEEARTQTEDALSSEVSSENNSIY